MRPTITRLTTVMAVLLLAAPLMANAQQPAKVPRIGYLNPGTGGGPRTEAFQKGLRELGWVEGQNVVVEYRWAEGRDDRLRDSAADLARLKVDVIVAISSRAVRAARNATRTIPIAALDLESDPVATGLAASLSRPQGNVTGLFLDLPGLNAKWLQLLREALPRASRVAVLWDSATDPAPLRATEALAPSAGMQLQVLEVRRREDFAGAFLAARTGRAEALMVFQSPITDRKEVADLASESRLPAIGMFRKFVEDGGLMSYGPHLDDLFRYLPSFVDKILKGAKPGELPVERPTKYDMAINLKTAKALRLAIPQSLLLRADHLID